MVTREAPVAAILLTEPSRKWQTRVPPILQESLIFTRHERKGIYFLLNFENSKLKLSEVHEFLEYLWYMVIIGANMMLSY